MKKISRFEGFLKNCPLSAKIRKRNFGKESDLRRRYEGTGSIRQRECCRRIISSMRMITQNNECCRINIENEKGKI